MIYNNFLELKDYIDVGKVASDGSVHIANSGIWHGILHLGMLFDGNHKYSIILQVRTRGHLPVTETPGISQHHTKGGMTVVR